MSKRTSHHSFQERLEAVHRVMSNKSSPNEVSHELKISITTLKNWIRAYRHNGPNGLHESHTWRRYSHTLKIAAVTDYLSGHYSLEECCNKYNISSESVLSKWIHQYTNGKTLKPSQGGSTRMRVSSRKTTFEERLAIVHFVLKHEKNYLAAVQKYQVSYAQVYNWVRKYEHEGENGLIDYRGKHRPHSKPLTETERLNREIKQLKQQNEELAAENFLLKKLGALKNFKP